MKRWVLHNVAAVAFRRRGFHRVSMSAVFCLEVFQSSVELGATRILAVGHCKNKSSWDIFELSQRAYDLKHSLRDGVLFTAAFAGHVLHRSRCHPRASGL